MVAPVPVHPEDIKATIRKRYPSLKHFEQARGLKRRSVSDVLRGRISRPTAEAIAAELGHSIDALFPGLYESANADTLTLNRNGAHRQIARPHRAVR